MGKAVNQGRWTAEIEGDFVVFLIGARINSPLRIRRSIQDYGGRKGMGHMLKYLSERPEKGLLGYTMGYPVIVQYWRSFDHLEAFARDQEDPHAQVWCATTGSGSARTTGPASGTRRSWCGRASTRRCTATCRRSVSGRRRGSYASPSPPRRRGRLKQAAGAGG